MRCRTDIDCGRPQRIYGYKQYVRIVANVLRKLILTQDPRPCLSIIKRLIHSALRISWCTCNAEIDRPAVIRSGIDISRPSQPHAGSEVGPGLASVAAPVQSTWKAKLVLLA